ncbi:unnamed protein product [Ectocarpus sp. 4 AP-2014]
MHHVVCPYIFPLRSRWVHLFLEHAGYTGSRRRRRRRRRRQWWGRRYQQDVNEAPIHR